MTVSARCWPRDRRYARKAPQVLQNVVTYTVVLATANPDDILLPGMTALARISVSRGGKSLKVPLAALRFKPNKSVAAEIPPVDAANASIWIVGKDGRPRSVPAALGDDDGEQIAIRSGDLAPSDRVIV